MLSDVLIRLRGLFRRDTVENELDEELRFHFEQQVDKFVRTGMSLPEARRRARLEFGGSDEIKEACRDARGTRWLEDFIRDGRYGLRVLSRSPVFTSVAILSLALGIGANTAIFSLMDRVIFRMMPVRQPEPEPEPMLMAEADPVLEMDMDDLDTPAYLRQGRLLN